MVLVECVRERAACVNNDVRMHCLAQCMWECILAFAHVHTAKMAVNSVRMFLWVNWPLTVICLCTSHTVTCITFTNKHTQGYQRPVRTSPLAGLRWKRTGMTWRSSCNNAECQKYGFFLSFFDSLLLTSIENQKHKNRGYGNTQLTVNNKIQTV